MCYWRRRAFNLSKFQETPCTNFSRKICIRMPTKSQLDQGLKPADHFKRREFLLVNYRWGTFSTQQINKQNCPFWFAVNSQLFTRRQCIHHTSPFGAVLRQLEWLGRTILKMRLEIAVTLNCLRYRTMIIHFLSPILIDLDLGYMCFQHDGATRETTHERQIFQIV